ncbi:MipA/OmpV family protein [Allosphingosinicella vermicomposti]|uniref:MipA/OmpV family protein n=1 Tax=Allosphingosinicella vermicomposti TaxID=614671 RepID=UPI000D1037BE|nr:MipA/OmpV family protein [Allosphingosinicella vermicomposti]
MNNERPLAAALALTASLFLLSGPAAAQDEGDTTRVRIGVGAQVVPSYPGADEVRWRPLWDVGRARPGETFGFEAPDESFGIPVISTNGFEIGPILNYEGSRKPDEVGAPLDKVKATFEAGVGADYYLSDNFRLRAEARRGIGGHDGWIGVVGGDYIMRDGDDYLFSIGPRVTLANGRYHRAYFGVTPEESVRTGLSAYRPGGGIQTAGASASFLYQLTPRWGLYSYAKYDRLVGDAADSPIVRAFGSRDQFSGGLAVTYTFNWTK